MLRDLLSQGDKRLGFWPEVLKRVWGDEERPRGVGSAATGVIMSANMLLPKRAALVSM